MPNFQKIVSMANSGLNFDFRLGEYNSRGGLFKKRYNILT